MQTLHSDLGNGRWFTMTLAAQLGNVGSEYERAVRWKQRNNMQHFQNAFERMLELLDLTIEDQRWNNHHLRELVRLREVICEEFCGANTSQAGSLTKYFRDFAVLARRGVESRSLI